MTADAGTLPPRLQEIAEEFTACAGLDAPADCCWSSPRTCRRCPARYADHHDLLEQVPECQTPLFLAVEVDADGIVHLFFDAPREAPTTRGFAGILHAALDGLGADEVLETPGEFPPGSGCWTW